MNLIAGTGTQRAAKNSRVQVGGANLTFASWEASITIPDLVTTNFESYNAADDQTYSEGIIGVATSDFKFGGSWDAAAIPTTNPPGLYPRDDLPSVTLIASRATGLGSGRSWSYTYARVRGCTNSGSVDGLVLFNVTDAKNQGRFTAP